MDAQATKILSSIGEHRLPGSLYLCKSIGSYAMDVISEPVINEEEKSARFLISTEDIDRVGHTVDQTGFDFSLWNMNPVVLFNHGAEFPFPPATSAAADGSIALEQTDEGTFAKAFFDVTNDWSRQIWGLVKSKLLRAASVGISPVEAFPFYDGGEEFLRIAKCLMNEWSICPIGINPFALAKSMKRFKSDVGKQRFEILQKNWQLQCDAANAIFSAGKIDGDALDPTIKAFVASLVPRSTSGIGFDLEKPKGEEMTKKSISKEELKKWKQGQFLKAMAEIEKYDDPSQAAIREAAVEAADAAPANEPPPTETESETEEPETDSTPLGLKVSMAILDSLRELSTKAETALGPVENAELKAKLAEELTNLTTSMTAIEGIIKQSYPDAPLPSEEKAVDEEMVKSWLVSSSRNQFQLIALAGRIESVAKSLSGKALPGVVKSLINTAADLNRLGQAAKSYKPDDGKKKVEEIEKAFTSLAAKFQEFVTKLGNTPV